MNESNIERKKRLTLSDTLILSGITFLGYALAHIYELGYAKATGIPNYLVEISISRLLFACFSILFPAFVLIDIFYGWYRRGSDAYKSSGKVLLLRFLLPTALATAACFIYRFKWDEIAPYLIFSAALAVLIPILALFQSAKRILGPKTIQTETNVENSSPSVFDPLIQWFGDGVVWLLIAFGILFAIAYMAGRAESLFQIDYLVFNDQKPYVILRVYGDKAILRGIDRKSHSFNDEIQILKIGETNSTSFKEESIGPLSFKTLNANKTNSR